MQSLDNNSTDLTRREQLEKTLFSGGGGGGLAKFGRVSLNTPEEVHPKQKKKYVNTEFLDDCGALTPYNVPHLELESRYSIT